jgi:15-cis-phytoene synthase / lycopene beta-cyclase
VHLQNEALPASRHLIAKRRTGQTVFALLIGLSLLPQFRNAEGTYMKLIILWATPVMLFLWTMSYQLLLSLPWTKTWLVIWLPTLYLWVVDTLALKRGTWSITSGTKLGIHVWPHLEIEEAVFFLATNTLVVWGCFAFDNAVAILDAFPDQFPSVPGMPSPLLLMKSLLLPTSSYDQKRLQGIQNGLDVLAKKSRSFYLASGVFNGRLRIDLILLYGFCRVADDLIDDAPNAKEAQDWIDRFTAYLDAVYTKSNSTETVQASLDCFPPDARSILELLPVDRLPPKPLYELLEGFKIDLRFSSENKNPIRTSADLKRYATCVAATIGELCLSLVYYHDPDRAIDDDRKERCIAAGARMGRALQYTNIARDVTTDAKAGRCYIPAEWLRDRSLKNTSESELVQLRKRILDMAFSIYSEERDAIEDLPLYARDGIRVAVESYMEIARVLDHRIQHGENLDFAGGGKKGKASVPKLRRLIVGWRAMSGVRGHTGGR